MQLSTFKEIISENSATLEALAGEKKFVIGSLPVGTLLTDEASAEANAELFSDDAAAAMNALLKADFLSNYKTAVLIDFSKAVSLYLGSDQPETEKIETSFMMARVNFMGTDGIRGKVVLEPGMDFISALLKDNAFTPDLVSITSFSFATMLKEKGVHKAGDTVVIGNDGRDKAYDWKLNDAVKDGFTRAGLNVIDTGIVPTAIIPWKMLQLGHRGGACLTASHNPSNQNGIKFFIDGAKLLPEGDMGDFLLSALMFNYCKLEEMPAPSAKSTDLDCEADSVQWMLDILPENMKEALDDSILVFDSANGATDSIGKSVLDSLGANYTTKNETPTGDNINRSCGVAEIEGTELFKGTEYDSHIPFVQEMFDKGRANEAGKVWGIPLDGDGDRGFLMYYDKKNDDVHVLDGDKCGYILAEYLIKKQGLNAKDYWFLSTIESDIMTASAAEANLGLNTRVVSVGDKWIGNFPDGEVVVGLEISGHLIFPIKVKDNNGAEKTLLSGVGLLTGLVALAAVKSLELEEERILEPFEPGFSKTFYVFFVDKTKHFRGSAIWNKDIKLVEAEVEAAKAAGSLPADTKIVIKDKEDPNVLYMNLKSGDKLLGVLFMRNSGTEDKNATYVKGETAYEEVLVSIGKKVQVMHTEEMKNEGRIEYTYEKIAMAELAKGDATVESILEAVTAAGETVTETDLFSVLYGLKKEGRVAVEGRTVKLK
jgi:phosphoglucosamine mutase